MSGSDSDTSLSSVESRNTGVILSVAEVGLGALACATTCLLYTSYFTTLSYLLPLWSSVAGAAVLAGVAALGRWRANATLLAAALGFVVLAVFGVFTSTLSFGVPTVHTAVELGAGLVRGWARMLTVSLPAEATGELLVTPAVITWSAAFLVTTLALRTRSVLVPLVPPLLALVVALLFTATRTDSGLLVTAVFLVTVLSLVLVRSSRLDSNALDSIGAADQPDQQRQVRKPASGGGLRLVAGRGVVGVPIVLAAALVGIGGVGLVPVATGDERFDPREVIPLPLKLQDTITPLATLKSQLRDPQRELFTVRIDNNDTGAGIDRVHTAVLDSFDGTRWTSEDSFLVAGRTLRPDPSLTHPQQVAIHVSIIQLDGPYLPSAGWPVHINQPGFGFSSASGALVSTDPLNGLSYDMVGEWRPPGDDALRYAVPNRTEGSDRYTRLPPDLPLEIQAKGVELTATTSIPHSQLVAIETYLQTLPYSLDARPGHSYYTLRRLLSSDPGEQIGYAEQHASAFAVLARSQGFPTRVAVGYRLNPDQRNDTTYTVTSGDAHAWAEVNLAGYGWVAFDPTDPYRTPAAPDEPTPESGPDDAPADSDESESPPVADPNPSAGDTKSSLLRWALLPLAILVLVLVLVPVAIAGVKIQRRHRRSRGSAAAQIVGAWRETTDRLLEHGVAVPWSLTAQEVAQRADQQLGRPAAAVAVLAPIVTKAIFCPIPPEDNSVREAWELHAQLRRDLRQVGGPLDRIRTWLDPRPLVIVWLDRRRRRRSLERLQGG